MPMATRSRIHVVTLPLLAVLLGCGGSNAQFPDDPADSASTDDTSTTGDGSTTDGTSSDSTSTLDGDAATDITSDAPCEGGKTRCGDVCVDTSTDPRNCGSCGKACGDLGVSCVGGSCKCTGEVCGGVCVNTKTDAKNCGGCGKAVCHGEVCIDGKPACGPGFKACGGAGPGCLGCREITTDHDNCGDCYIGCGLGVCAKGVCGSTCPPGLTACSAFPIGSSCADLTRDISHCGDCATRCAPGEFCVASKCVPYFGAVGCTTCPCTTCKPPAPTCCGYAKTAVCTAGACPAG